MGTNPQLKRGTTSACAENTHASVTSGAMVWNYLRVRGEYEYLRYDFFPDSELPPRARRIRGIDMDLFRTRGTTSACAENTDFKISLC